MDILAVAVHSTVILLTMEAIALLVFDKVGLTILRHAWFNVDQLWAGSLVIAGVLTIVL